MRKFISFLMMAVFSAGLFAATETTVYYTASTDVIKTYSVKLNTNQQTNPDVWKTYVMTKTELTYNGDPVYSASFTDLWDGVDKMQFQLYDGDTWKAQDQPISSWKSASEYNGKMYVHATGKWEDAPSGAVASVTLYFVNAEDWNGVMACVYDAENDESYKAYPGEEMVKTDKKLKGKDVYSYTFPENYRDIIFESKDGTKKTSYYAWNKLTPYYYEDGDGVADNNWHAEADLIENVTIYMVNTLDWTTVKAFVWGSVAYKEWPGEAMTKTSDKALGKDVYKYTFPENNINIIFDDGASTPIQTVDLKWSKEKPYFVPGNKNGEGKYEGEWYASLDEIEPVVPGTSTKFYVTGDSALIVDAGLDKGQAWNPSAIKSMKDTFELNLKANQDYKLKITLGGDWKTGRGFDKLSKKIDGLSGDNDDNINFKLNEAGAVKVVFKALENDTTFELLGNFFIPDPATVAKFYVTGDSALIVDAGLDKGKAWSPDAFKSMKDTFELTLKANQEYKLNLTRNGDWGTKTGYSKLTEKADGLSGDDDDNICFKLNNAGVVKVVYFVKDEQLTYKLIGDFFVYVPEHKDGFYMMSSHNEWAIDDNYMFAATETDGEYILNVTLAVDQEIKPAYVEKDAAKDWYPATGDNYKVAAEYAGARTIYFRPAGNEDAAWQAFGGFFYIVPNDPTGMESIQPSAISSQKVIENGMLIIEKAGVRYNVMGQKVR